MEKTELQAKMDETPEHFYSFKKPYVFEGKEYTGIDIGKVEELSTEDFCIVDRYFERKGRQIAIPEADREYCLALAALANHLPFEFFKKIPGVESAKIRARVQSFLFG